MFRTFSIASLALAVFACSAAANEIDPAQAIAQKFSEASDAKPAGKPAPATAVPPATTTAATPARPDLDYEMDMLRRARAEELEREQQDGEKPAPAPPTKIAQPAPAVTPPEPAAQPASPSPPAPSPAPPAAAPAATAQTAAAPASTPEAAPVAVATTPAPPSAPGAAPETADAGLDGQPRATVLLVLEADRSDDIAVSRPDPIICLGDRCWLSNGIEAPARPLLRSQALALKTSEQATSDSCSGKSACVYRNVAIGPDSQIQVAELGDGHGATGSGYTVAADSTCRKDDGDLVCDNALVTHDFRIWVVPEPTAQSIGAAGLEDAIVAGLPEVDGQPANDK